MSDATRRAYAERDRLVAALSKVYPSHLCKDPQGEAGFGTFVCVHLDTGQATWHVHDSERVWFKHLQVLDTHWDGHTTKQKYDRLNALLPLYDQSSVLASGGRLEDAE